MSATARRDDSGWGKYRCESLTKTRAPISFEKDAPRLPRRCYQVARILIDGHWFCRRHARERGVDS